MTGKTPIDVEHLLLWAAAQSVAPALRGVSDRALMYNHGYTAIPKGCGGGFTGGTVLVEGGRRAEDIDADLVMRTVDRLDPWSRSIVLGNAKGKRRPDWMEGVEPRLVTVPGKRSRKRHRREPRQRWVPVDPQAVRASREIYLRWHSALRHLARLLDDRLLSWQITGLEAPETPWNDDVQKAA